jgi:catechol 2,3-dioxygenase-like lactoylglutathione lyase family enzyme
MKATLQSASGYQGNELDLPVKDVEAAIPFYEQFLGFVVEGRDGGREHNAVLTRDGIRIGLAENGRDPEQDGCAFRVDSAEAAREEFKARGLQAVSEIKTEKQGDASFKVFYVVAPDGLCYWFGERMAEH